MSRKTSKSIKIGSLTLLAIPIILWLLYFNFAIGNLPWVSYFGPVLDIESNADKATCYISPQIMITATDYDLLDKAMRFIDNHRWRKDISIGKATIQSYFGHDGIDYGGVIVTGPAFIITVERNGGGPVFKKYYRLMTMDLREFCGDTPKNKVCAFNNPFKEFNDLFWGLVIYSLVSVAASPMLLQMSLHDNREEG